MRLGLFSLLIAGLAFGLTDHLSAQPGGGRGGRDADLFGLLRMQSVQGEIELVDDQMEEIEMLQEEMWTEMRQKMSSIRDLAPEERREKFAELREEITERREEYQAKIEQVLLPNQLKRLKELQIQRVARRGDRGTIGILDNEEICEELGIDEATREKLEKKSEEVLKELTEKIKKLRAQAEDEILSVLSSDQRKKYREKIGATFDFGNERGAGIGGRRGRGGGDEGGRGRRGRGLQDRGD